MQEQVDEKQLAGIVTILARHGKIVDYRTYGYRDLASGAPTKLQRVSAPLVSPDGDWVVYSVSQTDVKKDKGQSHLWIVKWDGSVRLQLTFGEEGTGSPKFSPDGKYISFLSSRPGPAKGNQVWVMDRRGGKQQVPAITDKDIDGYSWSPDSTQLLLTLAPKEEPDAEEGKPPAPPKPIVIDRYHFKQDVHGYLHDDESALYLYDIATKKTDKLTTLKNVDEEDAESSPDGAWIAFVANADLDPDRSNNSDVFVVAPKAGSAPKKLTTWNGPDGGRLAWSPDSKSIAYARRGVETAGVLAGETGGCYIGREGELPGGKDGSQCSCADLLAGWAFELPGGRRPQPISG